MVFWKNFWKDYKLFKKNKNEINLISKEDIINGFEEFIDRL